MFTSVLVVKPMFLSMFGAIRALRNAMGVGAVPNIQKKKALRKCTVQRY